MTKSTITRERAQQIFLGNGPEPSASEERELARMALAAMDSESGCLPLDYLQGHKDGLEWASQLAEANHPDTGDWLYDDPIELAKAIRKGPDMPPSQPVADSEPVIVVGDDGGDALSYRRLIQSFEPGTKLYRHAQPVPVVPDAYVRDERGRMMLNGVCEPKIGFGTGWNACRAAMLATSQQSPGSEPATVPGKWIPVSERMPENDGAYLCWDNRYVTTYAFIFGAWQANQFIAKNITHWMPLPAGPQEVR